MQIKRSQKTIIVTLIAFLAMFLIFELFLSRAEMIVRLIYWLIAIIALEIFTLSTIGFKTDKSILRFSTTRLVVLHFLLIGILLFVVGSFVGMHKVEFSWISIPIFGFIIAIELFRYTLLANHRERWELIAAFIALSTLISFTTVVDFTTFMQSSTPIVVIITTLCGILATELICTYFSLRISLIPAIIYHVIIVMAPLIIPYQPQLGGALSLIFTIATPLLCFILVLHHEKYSERHIKKARRFSISFLTIPIIVILAAYAVIISGITPYRMIAIASNSMKPTISRGDALIYRSDVDIKTDDIIVFKRGNEIIAHRVTEVVKQRSGTYYRTKGDNAGNADLYLVDPESVLGRVEIVNYYVGYPTILLNEAFSREE
ncbi:signal peptidase I [Candidatus Saccharibacteria bacterium]|nr:signal peptidase I [Candidatus Saccharibacteria bacterium]